MQTKLMRFGTGILSALAACAAFGQIKWVPSFETAVGQAKTANKIVMVEFYTTWDGNGQHLEQDTFTQQESIAVANKFVPVRVNVEKEGKDLAKKFHITNYPTLLFVDKNQDVVGIIDGYEASEEFVKHGNTFLKDYKDLPGLEAKYKANRKNLDVVAHIGLIYADRYQIAPALEKLAEAEKLDPSNKTDKLSDLYNGIADFYQNGSNFEPAIKYFDKSANTSKVTDKRAYGYLSIVSCYFSLAQLDPGFPYETPITPEKARSYLRLAVPYLKACQKLSLKDEDKKIAEQDATVLRAALGSGGQ